MSTFIKEADETIIVVFGIARVNIPFIARKIAEAISGLDVENKRNCSQTDFRSSILGGVVSVEHLTNHGKEIIGS